MSGPVGSTSSVRPDPLDVLVRTSRVAALALLLAACAGGEPGATQEEAAAAAACRVLQPPTEIRHPELAETSGAALGAGPGEVVWTHSDSGGETALYALRPDGEVLGSVEIEGADNRDWEDLAAGPCPAGRCLYIADVGDNEGEREEVSIYRVPEPEVGGAPVRAERFRVRYPGGPRDAESLFVLPDGGVYLITKGRNSNVALYRYPLPLRADETVELERVLDFSRSEVEIGRQLTAASATPDGRWVAVRDYQALRIHSAERLLAGDPAPAATFDLGPLDEPQGEAVVLLDNGRVVLTSEGVGKDAPGLVSVLACTLPDG